MEHRYFPFPVLGAFKTSASTLVFLCLVSTSLNLVPLHLTRVIRMCPKWPSGPLAIARVSWPKGRLAKAKKGYCDQVVGVVVWPKGRLAI